jgi:hypothetical protein
MLFEQKYNEKIHKIINNYFLTNVSNKQSIVTIEFYAYNQFLIESKILNKKPKNNIFQILKFPYFEFISTDYKKDTNDLIDLLKSNILESQIKVKEFDPFFQFYGYSTQIYYEDFKM